MTSRLPTLHEAAALVRRREVSVTELVRAAYGQADLWEPEIASLVERCEERALERARAAEREIASGRHRGPLHGIPITVKDLIDVEGVPTRAGSRILANNVPERSAPCVELLEEVGAIVVAKANTHEFAWGGTTPPTRNPWDTSRIPGGSSGGSGAAVAAGIGYASLATDTVASVRSPAAFCGVVGLKPTFGRVSTEGVIPLAPSLDTVGVIARTVEDAAAVLDAVSAQRRLAKGAAGLRVGVPEAFFFDLIQPEVEPVLRATLRSLEEAGARVVTVRLDAPEAIEAATGAGFTICGAESAAWHRPWLDTKPDLYQPDVRRYLEAGRHIAAIDYLDAQRWRSVISATFASALGSVDVLATPAQPHVAPRVGEDVVDYGPGGTCDRDPAGIRCLCPVSLAGLPAVSVPVGFAAGLPVGLQLVGRRFGEAVLLRAARAVEDAVGIVDVHPSPPVASGVGGLSRMDFAPVFEHDVRR